MIIDQVKELIEVGKITEANKLLGYNYQTKGRLIRAQIQGLSIVIPSDDLQQVPTGGNYKGIVKIAGQEKLTKIVVNDSTDQSVPRIIFVDLKHFEELPHVSSLPVSISWVGKEDRLKY
ncbi:MAG: hypothetical protein LKF37_06910 [Lentilactobacillus diolivorans]|jgi:riboflavin kinase/FMN adenylyltransferase|nr:hypothetical protein [Lentilactobacillus diolivorans]RRG03497.1 MAG: hypothetical protein DUD34_04275 [Lactobacillus sp.]